MNRDYNFVYSDRRTISVSISSDNVVTVRCPRRVDPKRVESFLAEKSEWIEKHLANNAENLGENADIVSYNNIYVAGEKRKLVMGVKNSVTPEAVYIKSMRNLKSLYCESFGERFLATVAEISQAAELNPKSVAFKSYKSRWGCCNADNSIIFNYKLLMLPESLQSYVIVHELCHIKYHNHSKRFYALVASCLPNYKMLERELKNYNFITRLY